MKLALIGATGLVGQMMIKVMEERQLPCDDFIPAASERSVGKTIQFRGKAYQICSISEAVEARPDVAVFSAGAQASLEWARAFTRQGTYVVDNSSAWRMDPNAPLIVPEVNGHEVGKEKLLIANPNCSTIQMVVALAPLHKHFNIKRLVISTYQSVTGTGVKAVRQLENERSGITDEMVYPYPIDLNCIPHGGAFNESGYTTEEIKLVEETRKILGDQSIQITATVVRIPVMGGHSEAINIEFHKSFDMQEVRELLGNTPGLVLQDDPVNNVYPMPLYAQHKDEVFAGRLRRDTSVANGLNIWVVGDNLRKGAATNAIQIVELLRGRNFIA